VLFRIGPPPWVSFVAALIFLGFSLLFILGATLGEIGELSLFGYAVLGKPAATVAAYLMGVFLGLGAVLVMFGLRRKLNDDSWMRLEKDRLVIGGFGLAGEEQKIHYREVDDLSSFKHRGQRTLVVRCRDGSKTEIPAILFTAAGAFETFVATLEEYVDQAATRRG
jgi:hypothetical protein